MTGNHQFRIYWELGRESGYSDWFDAECATTEDDHDELHEGACCPGLQYAIEASGFGWSVEFREAPHALQCQHCAFPQKAHKRADQRCPAVEPGWLSTTFEPAEA